MWAPRSGRVASAVVIALVVLGTATPFAVALAPDAAAQQQSSAVFAQQGVDTDSVRLVVSVDANGTAAWEVQYWTRLDDENTTAAFESLRSDIESNPENYSDRFASRMRATVDAAENSTGREMNATDFAVAAETRTPPQYGVVVYSFEWTGFAAVDDGTLRVGDAIEGIFLDEQTRLVIEWPEDYGVTEIEPEADERRADAAVWRGAETSFVSGEPRLVLTPGTNGTPEDGTGASGSDGAGGTPGDEGGGGGGVPLLPVVAVVAVVGLGVVGWLGRERLRALVGGADERTATANGRGEAAGEDGTTGGAEAQATEPSDDPPDESLLSNEERVIRFVEEQGGRVKQQEIVQAFDWTEARTSQILRDLRDEGKLEGFRLGRENVLKLPDEE